MAEITFDDLIPQKAEPTFEDLVPKQTGIQRVVRDVGHTLSGAADTVGNAAMEFMRGYPRAVGRIAGVSVEGVNRGLAAALDLPIGVVNATLRAVGLPPASDPERGFKKLFQHLGFVGKVDPQDLTERVMMRIGEEIGFAMVPGMAATGAARAIGPAVSPIARFLQEVAKDPAGFMRREAVLAAQSGTGAAGAREVGAGDVGEAAAQIGTPLAIQAGGAGLSGIAGALNVGQRAQEKYVAGRMMAASGAQGPQALAHEIDVGAREYGAIPGFNPTVAQSVPSARMQGLERNIATHVGGTETLNDRMMTQAEAVRQTLGFNDPRLMEEAAGRTIRESLENRLSGLKEARATMSEPLYTAARQSPAQVDPSAPLTRLEGVLKTAKGDDADAIEKAIRAFTVRGTADIDTSVDGLISTRSELARILNDPKTPGFAAETIKGAQKDLDDAIASVSPEFRQASAMYRAGSQPINEMAEKPVGPVLKRTQETRAYEMPESRVPEQFVGVGKAQPESFGALVASVGGRTQAIEAAKTILKQNMTDAISLSGEKVSARRFGNYLRDNQSLIRGAFGGDHFNNLMQIRNLIRRAEISTDPVTPQSPTAYLQAQKTSRTLFEKLGIAIRQGAERVGQLKPLSVRAIARRAARGEVESSGIMADMLLRDALFNPQLAKDLLTRVGTREAEQAAVRLRGYLGNLGGEEEQ